MGMIDLSKRRHIVWKNLQCKERSLRKNFAENL